MDPAGRELSGLLVILKNPAPRSLAFRPRTSALVPQFSTPSYLVKKVNCATLLLGIGGLLISLSKAMSP